MSAPAENDRRPAPRSTSARTPSIAEASASSFGRLVNMAYVRALSRSGRLMVRVTTGPSRSSRSGSVAVSSVAIACSFTKLRFHDHLARRSPQVGQGLVVALLNQLRLVTGVREAREVQMHENQLAVSTEVARTL